MLSPRIRFDEFNDDWEQRKLDDVMSCVTDYVAAGSFADIKNNVSYMSEPDFAQLVRTVDLKKKFTNNDFVYVDKNAFDYLWRVNLNEECIVLPNIGANIGEVYYVTPSDLPCENNVLGPNAILLKTENDTYFVFTSLSSDDFQKQLFENVGSSGQPKFNKTELKSILLSIPSMQEQEKIGAYFKNLDNLITLHQRKCDETKEIKKYMLQKMFPKNGETKPEIRFSGFTDDWEQRKVSEVAEIVAGGTPSTKINSYWEPKEVPWLSSGEVHKKYITFTDNMISQEGMDNSSAKMIKENSVLIALAGQGKTRGTVAINRIPLTTNQSIAAMTFNDDIVPEFVFCNLENRYDEIRKMSSGDGARGGLNKQLVGDIEIPYTSFEEQKKIGTYFGQLDNLITLHQRKCDELKDIKKYMLQNMFPQKG